MRLFGRIPCVGTRALHWLVSGGRVPSTAAEPGCPGHRAPTQPAHALGCRGCGLGARLVASASRRRSGPVQLLPAACRIAW